MILRSSRLASHCSSLACRLSCLFDIFCSVGSGPFVAVEDAGSSDSFWLSVVAPGIAFWPSVCSAEGASSCALLIAPVISGSDS
ncbi:hypothetical protein BDW60DRAFT_179622 [Aspergillus nidulans var. acristatus]